MSHPDHVADRNQHSQMYWSNSRWSLKKINVSDGIGQVLKRAHRSQGKLLCGNDHLVRAKEEDISVSTENNHKVTCGHYCLAF